jgi:hypothetical protein
LVGAKPQEVGEIGVEARNTAPDAIAEDGIKPRASAEHTIDELTRPPAVPSVEPRRPPVERRIEELSGAEVAADLGRDDPGLRYSARPAHRHARRGTVGHQLQTSGPATNRTGLTSMLGVIRPSCASCQERYSPPAPSALHAVRGALSTHRRRD